MAQVEPARKQIVGVGEQCDSGQAVSFRPIDGRAEQPGSQSLATLVRPYHHILKPGHLASFGGADTEEQADHAEDLRAFCQHEDPSHGRLGEQAFERPALLGRRGTEIALLLEEVGEKLDHLFHIGGTRLAHARELADPGGPRGAPIPFGITLILDEAIAYHEGIPGHHLQLSIQQQLTGLPKFRLHGLGFNAYIEGWALYAEELGKEVGFYQDPVSDYGRLSSELFRAVRLVVDTGIHSKGWSRDQVVEFMRKSGAVDEPTIQSETDRYIAWPAQALSYKLGQLKIRELRTRAQKELGPKFDIRAFHDEMLNGGTLPLDLLEARTDQWIAAQKSK
jgi:hypothetical protein